MKHAKKEKILEKIREAISTFVEQSECEWDCVTNDEYTIEEFNEVVEEVLG